MKAIETQSLGKQYAVDAPRAPRTTLREALAPRSWRPPARDSFWALRDVSLDVGFGEVVGVVGANGAGKSTLLRILARITPPTAGRATVPERTVAVLAEGAGFHPDLTGRENVELSGALFGAQPSDIARRFDRIVAFAGVDRFVDTPVKWFSSGMAARLALAVALQLEFDLLLLDEVFMTGDASFRQQCVERLRELGRDGHAVLLVSHNQAIVARVCDRVIHLTNGRLEAGD
jgi:lipopolysaccharide transport system ATP-binding protein